MDAPIPENATPGGSAACAARMIRGRFRGRWSPYVVGALIGVLSWVTFYGMGKALGTSTSFVQAAYLVESAVAPGHVADNAYFTSTVNPAKGKPMFDWQFLLVIGMVGGALIGSRLLDRERFRETVPALWAWRFGPNPWVRYAAAFAGGAILLFGARMAGGCTSGHGISGGLQLAVSSWTFFLAMFASGVVTAFALFGLKGRSHVQL